MNGTKLFFLSIIMGVTLGINAQTYSVKSAKNGNSRDAKSSKGIIVELNSQITDTLMNPPRKRVWKKGGKMMRWLMGDNVDLDLSPHIIKDYVDEKGSRIILCQSYGLENKGHKIGDPGIKLSLSAITLNSDTAYIVSLSLYKVTETSSFSLKIGKGDILLLKNCDGEMIELRSDYDSEDVIGKRVSSVSNSLGTTFIYVYEIHSSYSIKKEELRKMLKGISKIRVAYNMEYYDVDISDYELTDFLRLEYGLIDQVLQQKKTIYDGF